jgi:hypothetical protein
VIGLPLCVRMLQLCSERVDAGTCRLRGLLDRPLYRTKPMDHQPLGDDFWSEAARDTGRPYLPDVCLLADVVMPRAQ